MNRHLSPSYKPRVEAILQKTYDEHGLKGHPWGIKPDGNCSYREGCAIGVSMSPGVAASADNNGEGFIGPLLLRGDSAGVVAEDLFGTRSLPPESVVQALAEIQNIHDNFASDADDSNVTTSVYRAMYREQLENLAELWNLKLKAFDWGANHE